MSPAIEKLRMCASADQLNIALRLLCVPFGVVSSLKIVEVQKPGQRQMMCFLRLENIISMQRFSAEFSIGIFGGELILIVDLYAATTGVVAE